MSRAKPIWNQVEACIYKSSKSWGAKDTSAVTVNVGSSASNSHELVHHFTTRRFHEKYETAGIVYHDVCVFKFGVRTPDGTQLVLAEKIFSNNRGRAGELQSTVNHLNQLKEKAEK